MKGFDIEKQTTTTRKSYVHHVYMIIALICCMAYVLCVLFSAPPPAIPDNSLVQSKTYTAAPTAKEALMEILSVHPIIVLEDNESGKLSSLFANLNIIPEPKYVNLQIHPSSEEITTYLKNFENHVNGDHDFPRLFIGGNPIANYNQLMSLNSNGHLPSFLRVNGAGKIKVETNTVPPQVSLALRTQL
jgi:glutaredoxin